MRLDDISAMLQQGLMIWLFALAGLIVYRLVIDPSRLAGLLGDSKDGIDPERVQLALAMPAAVATYLGEAAKRFGDIQAGLVKEFTMPEAPPILLGLVAGSQILFLAGKYLRLPRP